MGQLDFSGLAQHLLSNAGRWAVRWLPGGKPRGHEYVCGNLCGGKGESLSVNLQTGAWADFATGEKGGDLISLYAACESVDQGEAFKRLADESGFRSALDTPPPAAAPVEEVLCKVPPKDTPDPDMKHWKLGQPVKAWQYRRADGRPMFWVARYNTPEGKQILPWSWHPTKGWIQKGFPTPRPLYGLDLLAQRPEAPVMIVEGEKAAEAARQLAGHLYVVVTWPNGARAHGKADWTPLKGRKVLIWPDADAPGMEAGEAIAARLTEQHVCQAAEVKIFRPPADALAGWDAADAVPEFKDWKELKAFLVPHVSPWSPAAGPETALIPAPAAVAVVVEPGLPAPANVVHISAAAEDGVDIPASTWEAVETCRLQKTRAGSPIVNMANVVKVLSLWRGFIDESGRSRIWYDEFEGKHFTTWCGPERVWSDADTTDLTHWLQVNLGMAKLGCATVNDAITVWGHRYSKRNHAKDWLQGLAWDQVPRIDRFFETHFGATDSVYLRAASKNWWLSMAARVMRPGCKVDNMVILEGEQGEFKSSALDAIGGRWFAESHYSVEKTDFLQALRGKLIVEVSELESFSKAEVSAIKRTVTCRIDHYRAPYGHYHQAVPRTCVLVGTTNETEYLRDHTGGRRFWPVTIGRLDLTAIRADREQLFAEAAARFAAGESWWEMPKEETKAEQSARQAHDEWEQIVTEWVVGQTEVTTYNIAKDLLNVPPVKIDRSIQMRLNKIMTRLGWRQKWRWSDGKNQRTWMPKGTDFPFGENVGEQMP